MLYPVQVRLDGLVGVRRRAGARPAFQVRPDELWDEWQLHPNPVARSIWEPTRLRDVEVHRLAGPGDLTADGLRSGLDGGTGLTPEERPGLRRRAAVDPVVLPVREPRVDDCAAAFAARAYPIHPSKTLNERRQRCALR